jgi:hypothetical protein
MNSYSVSKFHEFHEFYEFHINYILYILGFIKDDIICFRELTYF